VARGKRISVSNGSNPEVSNMKKTAKGGDKPPTKPAGVPHVRCAYAEMVATENLQPAHGNPNQHPAEQLRLYAKILRHQGWRKPIVISRQSGRIVSGHGAWLTARAEGWAQCPVDVQDFATPADEAAHMLADNKLPQLAELDEEAFAAVLRESVEGNLDLELAAVLDEEPVKVELKAVTVKEPPKMAWVLIGIPLVRFSEINGDVERISGLADTIVQTTVNDG
jgi:hypothetical protein